MIMAATFLGSSHFIYFFIYFLGLLDKGHITFAEACFLQCFIMGYIARIFIIFPEIYGRVGENVVKYVCRREEKDDDILQWILIILKQRNI